MIEKLLAIAQDMEEYAEHGEEYPDAEMLLDWAKKIKEAIENG